MSLKDIVTTDKVSRPPRICLYSVEGFGKSTFGASALNPICLPTEDGLDELEMAKLPRPTTFDEALASLRMLYEEDHDYRTLVIDTLDWLEPLIWEHVCTIHGHDGIESFGYGKGFVYALDEWVRLLKNLDKLRNDKGMAILLIAHSEIRRYDSPDTEPFDRYQMKLHRLVAAKVGEWVDALIFANYKVFTEKTDVGFKKKVTRGTGGIDRFMYTEERPAYKAKNRFGLPEELPFVKGEAWNVLMEAIKTSRTTKKKKEDKKDANK